MTANSALLAPLAALLLLATAAAADGACPAMAPTGTTVDAFATPHCEAEGVDLLGGTFRCTRLAQLNGTRVRLQLSDSCGNTWSEVITNPGCEFSTYVSRPTCVAGVGHIKAGVSMTVHVEGGVIVRDTGGFGSIVLPRKNTSSIPLAIKWDIMVGGDFQAGTSAIPPPYAVLVSDFQQGDTYGLSLWFTEPAPQVHGVANGTELAFSSSSCHGGLCSMSTSITGCGTYVVAARATHSCSEHDFKVHMCDLAFVETKFFTTVIHITCERNDTKFDASLQARIAVPAVETVSQRIEARAFLEDTKTLTKYASTLHSLTVEAYAAVDQLEPVSGVLTNGPAHVFPLIVDGVLTGYAAAWGVTSVPEGVLVQDVNLVYPKHMEVDFPGLGMKLGEKVVVVVKGELHLSDGSRRLRAFSSAPRALITASEDSFNFQLAHGPEGVVLQAQEQGPVAEVFLDSSSAPSPPSDAFPWFIPVAVAAAGLALLAVGGVAVAIIKKRRRTAYRVQPAPLAIVHP